MTSRPELQAPPDIFYNDAEARKYTSSSRIIEIQAKITDRALELLTLPDDGVPRLLLDIGCGSGLSGETLSEHGHQWIGLDISQSMLRIRPGVVDGAISISAVQWLCNADKSSHNPRLRLKVFFESLYKCLARGARAVLQVYPENVHQRELILGFAMRAGFAGGVVVDYPHSARSRKEYLVLTCGPPSISTTVPKGKDGDCSYGSTKEKAENHEERQRKRVGTEEEGTDEKKRKHCPS
ncbi:putative 18S rRNA (guanine-N(7))-methyltransferase [Cucumis melo var. makuwa]|uniref:Putative 18S rRNA (Guanine-N(7))-methyltransferase n=1 Tax=Cucumis melo var. makuwa TaxID=1194695 RepID=A0A5D3C266_CUCMM|nr:putative 18S rRNA (guanine-N(7))-methyltransferase [Cucumis melo var. makuwa]